MTKTHISYRVEQAERYGELFAKLFNSDVSLSRIERDYGIPRKDVTDMIRVWVWLNVAKRDKSRIPPRDASSDEWNLDIDELGQYVGVDSIGVSVDTDRVVACISNAQGYIDKEFQTLQEAVEWYDMMSEWLESTPNLIQNWMELGFLADSEMCTVAWGTKCPEVNHRVAEIYYMDNEQNLAA